jgi:hypothetical protein
LESVLSNGTLTTFTDEIASPTKEKTARRSTLPDGDDMLKLPAAGDGIVFFVNPVLIETAL